MADTSKKKNIKLSFNKIILTILFIVLIFVCVYNFCKYKLCFLQSDIGTILALIVAIVVSYILVEKKGDDRNRKEGLIKLLESIQNVVNNSDLWCAKSKSDTKLMTMGKRQLNNYAYILDSYCTYYKIDEEVNYIKDRIDEYSELLGNHIDDIDYLHKSEIELKRPLELIDCETHKIILKLYV